MKSSVRRSGKDLRHSGGDGPPRPSERAGTRTAKAICAKYSPNFAIPRDRLTTWEELGWTGDVKYHMGGYKSPQKGRRHDLVIRMPANPSHLELIDPLSEGMARAANTE